MRSKVCIKKDKRKIEFKDNIVKKNKIPILIYTPEWLRNFSDNMDEEVVEAKQELEAVFRREKELEKEIAELDGRKRTLMRKVLYVSKEIHDNSTPGAELVMDDTEKEIAEISESLPKLMEELEDVPGLINEKNTELLKATINRGLDLVAICKIESDEYQEEVLALRARLAELIKLKVDAQEKAQKIYFLMHSWIGNDEMERLEKNLPEGFLKKVT